MASAFPGPIDVTTFPSTTSLYARSLSRHIAGGREIVILALMLGKLQASNDAIAACPSVAPMSRRGSLSTC